ncbi:MAG TPA: hypothetical protein V6D16_17540, partial [Candidatus Obscuribacterales bacterium]
NAKVRQILKHSRKLSEIDPQTEEITKPLDHYSNGIIFEPLGDDGHLPNDSHRTISLNSKAIIQLTEKVPKQWLPISLLVFLCHEASHISQRVKYREDVQRMKGVGKDIGEKRMGELDLRSDFLAAHTLSLFFMLHDRKTYNRREYVKWFYEMWHKVCKAMLDAFPANPREDKQQRVFGYLLMSNLISDAYISNYPLEFEAELWPVWGDSLDWLSIYSSGNPLLSGSPVNPNLMEQILNNISTGEYDVAAAKIRKLWRQLPRR